MLPGLGLLTKNDRMYSLHSLSRSHGRHFGRSTNNNEEDITIHRDQAESAMSISQIQCPELAHIHLIDS